MLQYRGPLWNFMARFDDGLLLLTVEFARVLMAEATDG